MTSYESHHRLSEGKTGGTNMRHVILYTKEACTLCDEAELLLSFFMGTHPFELERRDINTNDEWFEKYHLEIPVIEMGGKQLYGEGINYESIKKLFQVNRSKDIPST